MSACSAIEKREGRKYCGHSVLEFIHRGLAWCVCITGYSMYAICVARPGACSHPKGIGSLTYRLSYAYLMLISLEDGCYILKGGCA